MTSYSITEVSSNTTASSLYQYYLLDASGGSITLTLPPASSDGMVFSAKRVDTNLLTTATVVGDTSSETIDGATSVLLLVNQRVNLISYNSDWFNF